MYGWYPYKDRIEFHMCMLGFCRRGGKNAAVVTDSAWETGREQRAFSCRKTLENPRQVGGEDGSKNGAPGY